MDKTHKMGIQPNIVFCDNDACVQYPSVKNCYWEILYKKYMTNIIKIVNVYSDINRLYLLIQLDVTSNEYELVIDTFQRKKYLIQLSEAVELSNNLKDMFPDADPIYLDIVGTIFVNDQNGLSVFIEKVTNKKKMYPKLQEYNDRVKAVKTILSLTDNFQIEEYLKICPDPVHHFKNVKINSRSYHYHESMSYLSNRFNLISIVKLRTILLINRYNLTDTVNALCIDTSHVYLKSKRKSSVNFSQTDYRKSENIEFLKEIAFIDHKDEILNHIETKKTMHTMKVEEAKFSGQLITCECCFDGEILAYEAYICEAGHTFCVSCIKKGIEVSVGAGKINFKCFADCNEDLNLTMIKNIIDDKLYERIMRLKQAQEIKAADIEGLETCAFCDYSVILPSDLKIINCLNPDCKKETCRECREESHCPLKCDQIEKTPEVQVRTMIENKMTDVLIRTCYYCNRKFVKEDGCNKMKCNCGKTMCYICRQPVDDNYSHFYHNLVIENKCPLYTEENIVHTKAVEVAARLIINELKVTKPELLRNIDINKILPELQKKRQSPHISALDENKVVAMLIGQDVEDVKNLQDMRALEPQRKKSKR